MRRFVEVGVARYYTGKALPFTAMLLYTLATWDKQINSAHSGSV